MPKRTKKNNRYLKGGDIIGTIPVKPIAQPSSFSTWFNGAKKAASSALSSASLAASSAANSATNAFNKTVNPAPPPPPPRTFGGKRRRNGGDSEYLSLTNLASTASPICGIPTAKAQVWVGGKTRKRKRHKHTKSCKDKPHKKSKRTKTMKFPFSNSLKRLIKM